MDQLAVGENSDSTEFQLLGDYLHACKKLVDEEIRQIVPTDNKHTGGLYKIALEYPLREGKALRPALAIAMCRSVGGLKSSVIRSAAVIELYHNAFLVHDDVEDGSELRRGSSTLHRTYGLPIAVNVGDGLLALTMEPLLDNMRLIGVGGAIRVLQVIAQMSRESAEGQMLELSWIRNPDYVPTPKEYIRMVYKKTAWYSFIAPTRIGAIAAGCPDEELLKYCRFAVPLGVVFQITDDLLNLDESSSEYGKEALGDLWEGKYTLMLIHALNNCTSKERTKALTILQKPRPDAQPSVLMHSASDIKTEADIDFLRELIREQRSIEFAANIVSLWHERTLRYLNSLEKQLPSSTSLRFLKELVTYSHKRKH